MSAGYRWSRNFDNGVKSANTNHEYVICFARINNLSDVMIEWRKYVAEEKERQLASIIQEENLKDAETRKFIEVAFCDGSVKTTGTDIDKLMLPMSRFGGGNRAEKSKVSLKNHWASLNGSLVFSKKHRFKNCYA